MTDYPIFKQIISGTLHEEVVPEFCFHPTRKWRFDFAVPSLMIAIEIEGGVYSRGRHTRGKGYINDMEKYNAAQLLGWQVFRFTPQQHAECLQLMEKIYKNSL